MSDPTINALAFAESLKVERDTLLKWLTHIAALAGKPATHEEIYNACLQAVAGHPAPEKKP